MASTTSVPVDQPQVRPSFAKVAASSYKPQNGKETSPVARSNVMSPPPTIHSEGAQRDGPGDNEAPKVRPDNEAEQAANNIAQSTVTGIEPWAKSTSPQVVLQPGPREEEPEKPRPSITLVKSLATEDSTTQLSSSDGSGKPPSLDGKSVASATTFALDEKESIRPDDSASLRAVEEEDITSPPDSVANGSRVGSDSGIARAFRDQLHEIAVIGPRGVLPPGRFPNVNPGNPQVLYDPNQPSNGMGRPLSQPLGSGASPPMTLPHNLPPSPDEKLIEALESPRDRLFVLKLEQDFIDFIKDSRETELSLPNCNTFYRMLAHRLADYYLLGHIVDTTMTGVKITRTHYCRIPPPLSGLPVSSKNANTPPVDLPARKIMRRGDDTGTNTTANSEGPSKTTSEVGGGSGSDGGNDANDAENKDKSAMTREEREARYREARQRIFGNAETEESEASESVRLEENDASRSSSASGKKKSKKQRNYDDDFEARSRFNAYYPQSYHAPNFTGDQTVYYGGFSGQMHNPQFAGMNTNVSPPPPPPSYNSGYPVMMPQDTQSQYGWSGPQFQPPNGAMGYPNYTNTQNGYELSGDFQRGMQSFQTAMPSQVTPKLANAPMASYQETYQPQSLPINPGWSQMNQQSSYSMGQPSYTPNGPASRPMSAPVQGPVPGQYTYGQFPPNAYNGKVPRNQHPVPGSYNRQFNPQMPAFIPGGRNVPYQMQPNLAPMPPQSMNGYGNFQIPQPVQMPVQLPGPSPPMTHQQSFGSPRSMQSSIIVPTKPSGPNPSLTPQIANSQIAHIHPSASQPNPSTALMQSSIAKWGTPSHLPPKPPPPAQPQPPKFNLPGHNNFTSSVPRAPNNMAQGYVVNSPIIRGGAGPSMPNNPSA